MDGSTKPCDQIASHLSALVDGELQPLEAIAVRRHVSQCQTCRATLAWIERAKVLVHVAASGPALPDDARARLQASLFGTATGSLRKRIPKLAWWWPLAAAAALAVGLSMPWLLAGEAALQPVLPAGSAAIVVDGSLLGRVAAVHAHRLSPVSLDDLRTAGALLALDELNGDFVTRHGERARIVLASYTECEVPTPGASLALFDSTRVVLSSDVASALDSKGVYVDVVDGIEVRLSRSGDRLLLLMAELRPGRADGAI